MKWTVRWKVNIRNGEDELESVEDRADFEIEAPDLRKARRKALLRVHGLIRSEQIELRERGSITPIIIDLIRGDGERFGYQYAP